MNNNTMDDNKIDDNKMDDNNSSRVFNILNIFIQEYNKKNRRNNHMFDGIDISDMSSTNTIMEEFYEHMSIHNELKNHNSSYIDVYGTDNFITPSDVNVYPYYLTINDRIKYISLSYISLLYLTVYMPGSAGKRRIAPVARQYFTRPTGLSWASSGMLGQMPVPRAPQGRA